MISQVLSQGSASSGASGLVAAAFDLAKFADFWDQHPLFQAIAGAVIIGTVGSAAYLTALFLGFLGDTPLKALRPRFETITGTPPVTRLSSLRFVAFVVFGGFVASVFQLAQGTTFAAVQALRPVHRPQPLKVRSCAQRASPVSHAQGQRIERTRP